MPRRGWSCFDLQEALLKKDHETAEMLREARAKYEREVAQVMASRQSLRPNMEELHEERYALLKKAMEEQQKAFKA
jgi:hypothetical protein